MGRQTPQTDAEKLEAAAASCRQLITEAHEVLKDLRTEMKQAKELVRDLAEGLVAEEVSRQLDMLGTSIDRAMEGGTAAVYDRFDKLAESLLTTRFSSDNLPTIQEMAFAADIIQWIIENAEKDAVPGDSTVTITPVERGLMERLQTQPNKTRMAYLGELPAGVQPGLMIAPSSGRLVTDILNPDAREDKPA